MTTTITVKTLDWPVQIEYIDMNAEQDYPNTCIIVPTFSQRDFAIWDTRQLKITELPIDTPS